MSTLSTSAVFFIALLLPRSSLAGEADAVRVRELLRRDRLDDALRAAQSAVAANPESPLSRCALGDAWFRSGRIPEAEGEYRQAVLRDEKCARAWWGISRILEMACLHATARRYLDKAHSLDARDPDIVRSWAHTRSSAAERIAALQRYLELANQDSIIEHIQEARVALELARQLGDRNINVMVSPYGPAEIRLDESDKSARNFSGYALRVSFNDGKPLRLKLDTGGTGFYLDRKTAEKAGVRKISNSMVWGFGDEGPSTAYKGIVERVRIGSLEFRNCLVEVGDRTLPSGDPGLIGTDVFVDFRITLDFPVRSLRLEPYPEKPNAGENRDRTHPAGREIYTRAYRLGHLLLIPVHVPPEPTSLFAIDSGALSNLVSKRLASATTALRSANRPGIRGLSGELRDVYSAHKVTLRFAGFEHTNENVMAFDFTTLSRISEVEISGFLGARLLSAFRLVIDYRNGWVAFERPSQR